ncbi:MFS transporter [Kitasatospora indigofera]|uniref:MFS transporter n=1 Tax=Kitasatospora indigofera TaxID=67307 RepID=UPI0033AA322F
MPATASSASSQSAPTSSAARKANVTILLACLGVFAAYLPVVGVSVALPVIQRALDASTVELQWVTDAFILPTAALLLTCGVLGERYGRKKVYTAGLTLFCLGSLVCLLAPNVALVCVGQALTGVGAAALLPATLALINHVCPDHGRRARAIALWTASLGLGLTLGPVINGVIVEHLSWRWIFLPALVIGAIVVVVGIFLLEETGASRTRHLDVPGQLLAVVAITGLVYGVIEGGSAGWTTPKALVAFVVAAAGFLAFILLELRSPAPMLDMRLFASRGFSGAAFIMAATLFAQVGLVFAVSEYFGLVHHASTLDIGLRLLALNGITVLVGPFVGRLMNRTSPGLVLTTGLVVGGVGALGVCLFHASTDTTTAALLIAVLGTGIALAIAPITTIAMNSVPRELAGTAGAANSALRQIGSALGPAVFGAVLTDRTLAALPGHLAASGLDPAAQGKVEGLVSHVGIQAGAFLRLDTPAATRQAMSAYGASFTDALHVCALISGFGLLVAAGVGLVLIGVRQRAPQEVAAASVPAQAAVPVAVADES